MKKSEVTVENLIRAGYVGKFQVTSVMKVRVTESPRALDHIVEAVQNQMEIEFRRDDIQRKVRAFVVDIQGDLIREWIERPYTEQEKMDAYTRLESIGVHVDYKEEG